MKILALSGSLSASSSTSALARAAAALAPPPLQVEVWGRLGELPLFNPDLDVDPGPAAVVALRQALAAADALLIVSPEYAHGMPGPLKNALDWLVSDPALPGTPALLVSASPGGARHAHAQLSEVLRTMSFVLVDGGAHVFSRAWLDEAGGLRPGPLQEALCQGLEALAGTTSKRAGPEGDERQ